MTALSIARHRTALNRTELSRPVRLALEDGLITQPLGDASLMNQSCQRSLLSAKPWEASIALSGLFAA
jgi:hypothetical protein